MISDKSLIFKKRKEKAYVRYDKMLTMFINQTLYHGKSLKISLKYVLAQVFIEMLCSKRQVFHYFANNIQEGMCFMTIGS